MRVLSSGFVIAGARVAGMTTGCADTSGQPTTAASVDTHAEEAKIRALDADWVKAAAPKSADAWVDSDLPAAP